MSAWMSPRTINTNACVHKCWYFRWMFTSAIDARIPIDAVSRETLERIPRAPEMFSRAEVGPYDAAVTASVAD